jgi:hypothetical protein
MWTPGFWAYSNDDGDYYWVAGEWVPAPYSGALWTPPYWGWNGGRYGFHDGYWGRHVGYYGRVNYGYGHGGNGFACGDMQEWEALTGSIALVALTMTVIGFMLGRRSPKEKSAARHGAVNVTAFSLRKQYGSGQPFSYVTRYSDEDSGTSPP